MAVVTGVGSAISRTTAERFAGEDDKVVIVDRHADAPRAVAERIDGAVGERTNGPLLARGDGSRLDRHTAVTVPSSG